MAKCPYIPTHNKQACCTRPVAEVFSKQLLDIGNKKLGYYDNTHLIKLSGNSATLLI